MEYTFSTQMLGTLLFFLTLGVLCFLGYKKKNVNYYKMSAFLLFLGFIFTFVWNPIKLDSPKMSTIEYYEKEEIVVPERVVVETQTLEQKQNKLEIKLEEN